MPSIDLKLSRDRSSFKVSAPIYTGVDYTVNLVDFPTGFYRLTVFDGLLEDVVAVSDKSKAGSQFTLKLSLATKEIRKKFAKLPHEVKVFHAFILLCSSDKENEGTASVLIEDDIMIEWNPLWEDSTTTTGTPIPYSFVGPKGDKGDKGDKGEKGDRGTSAYDYYVQEGGTLSFEEWLSYLQPTSNHTSNYDNPHRVSLPQVTGGAMYVENNAVHVSPIDGYAGLYTPFLQVNGEATVKGPLSAHSIRTYDLVSKRYYFEDNVLYGYVSKQEDPSDPDDLPYEYIDYYMPCIDDDDRMYPKPPPTRILATRAWVQDVLDGFADSVEWDELLPINTLLSMISGRNLIWCERDIENAHYKGEDCVEFGDLISSPYYVRSRKQPRIQIAFPTDTVFFDEEKWKFLPTALENFVYSRDGLRKIGCTTAITYDRTHLNSLLTVRNVYTITPREQAIIEGWEHLYDDYRRQNEDRRYVYVRSDRDEIPDGEFNNYHVTYVPGGLSSREPPEKTHLNMAVGSVGDFGGFNETNKRSMFYLPDAGMFADYYPEDIRPNDTNTLATVQQLADERTGLIGYVNLNIRRILDGDAGLVEDAPPAVSDGLVSWSRTVDASLSNIIPANGTVADADVQITNGDYSFHIGSDGYVLQNAQLDNVIITNGVSTTFYLDQSGDVVVSAADETLENSELGIKIMGQDQEHRTAKLTKKSLVLAQEWLGSTVITSSGVSVDTTNSGAFTESLFPNDSVASGENTLTRQKDLRYGILEFTAHVNDSLAIELKDRTLHIVHAIGASECVFTFDNAIPSKVADYVIHYHAGVPPTFPTDVTIVTNTGEEVESWAPLFVDGKHLLMTFTRIGTKMYYASIREVTA